ncbi:UMP-CMP kinase 3 [Jatropha curcas]|uniref:UMP-CMP kinase 3 n=1 Tax=Jatropha curcas TaxID=180498 RepID=UPI0018936F7F|nr:UMP-CMP kinase 3 [Jatropha curcas]
MGSSSINDAAIAKEKTDQEIDAVEKKPTIVFVLGGPGGGKSTQCANISKYIGFTHLSSGEELRKAGDSDPDNGEMIKSMLKDGLSVPPDITLRVLQEAMKKSGNDKFLLDGFPRDEEIRAAFEDALNIEPELVVFFHCSAEERKKRILSRNQGRVDDNVESVSKRFTYFDEYTLPVVEYYRSRGKVYEIDASKPMDEVFDTLKTCLTPLSPRIETEVVSEAS